MRGTDQAKKRGSSMISKSSSRVPIVSAAVVLSVFASVGEPFAAQTSGGVNWTDPAGYTKPAFVPLTVPDEATTPNKYYIDLNKGSGSTCSEVAPCAKIENTVGKAGTNGGPAYIYVRGTGTQIAFSSSTNPIFRGSAGNEIVIKPWSGTTTPITFSGNVN